MGVLVPILEPRAAFQQAVRGMLPSKEALAAAVASIPADDAPRLVKGPFGLRHEEVRWFVSVSFGTLRLTCKTNAFKDVGTGSMRLDEDKNGEITGVSWDDDTMDEDQEQGSTRGRISSFTDKARARMCDTFRSLDYSPFFIDGDIPAMVTLTCPADWESVFPTPQSWAKAREMFFRAYKRAWGHDLRCIWKTEFQERGAPHLHLLMVPPRGLSGGQGASKGLPFRQWLSLRWAEIVGVKDPHGFADHVKAGTRVEWSEGERYSDPKRIAVYFDKHAGYHEKDYQNEWPQLWRDAVAAGEGGTNIWGYTRNFDKVVLTRELRRSPGASSRPRLDSHDEPVMNHNRMPNAADLAGMDGSPNRGIMSSQRCGVPARLP